MYRTRLITLLLLSLTLSIALPAFAQDALTQSYFSQDGLISFKYPANWVVSSSNNTQLALNVSVGTTQDAITKDLINSANDTLSPGEVHVNLIVIQKGAILQGSGLSADSSVSDILGVLIQSETVAFDTVSETTVSGHDGAQVSYSAAERGEGFIVIADYGMVIGGAAVFAAPGEIEQWAETALGIVESLTISSPIASGLPQTYTSPDGQITFNYPDDWQTDTRSTAELFDILAASSTNALGKDIFFNFSHFDSGEVALQMFIGSPAALIGELKDIELTDDPAVFLPSYVQQLNALLHYTFGELNATSINDLPAAGMQFDAGEKGEGALLTIRLKENLLALISISAAAGELEQAQTVVQSIIASLAYHGILEATPIATASTDFPLTHFISSDEKLSFDYPANWEVDVSDSSASSLDVNVATSSGSLHLDPATRDDKIVPGEARINIVTIEKADVTQFAGVADDAPITDILAALVEQAGSGSAPFAPVEAVTVNDRAAAKASFNASERGEGYLLLIDFGDIIGGLGVYAASGEISRWEGIASGIANSLKYSAAEATPEVTPTPTPSGTATPLALDETYSNDAETVTFNYPSDWVLRDVSDPTAFLDISVANTQAASDKNLGSNNGDIFAPGEVKVQLLVIQQDMLLPSSGLTVESTPIEILEALQTASSAPTGMTMSVVSATSMHDLPGAQFELDMGINGEGRIILIRYRPGLLMLMAVFTAPGELVQWDATAQAVFESLVIDQDFAVPSTITRTVEPQTVTTSNNKTSFTYPGGWLMRSFSASGLYVANNEAALNHVLGGTFAPGEVQVLVVIDSIANLTPTINLGLEADASAAKVLQAFMKATSTFLTFEEPQELKVNGKVAVTVVAHGDSFDGRSTLIEFGDNQIGMVQVLTAPGELPQWENTAQTIMGSVVFSR